MRFAERANQFECDVSLATDEMEADGKSIIAVLTLGAKKGSTLRIRTKGSDASQAADALEAVLLETQAEEAEQESNSSKDAGTG
jgi:phosphotransferase system HPr (HPr) family protein